VGELRSADHDVADSVNAWLIRLQPLVDLDEPAIGLDFGLFQTDALCAGLATNGDQDFVGIDLLLLPVDGECDRNAVFRLFHLVHLGARVASDPALAIDAAQLFGNLFVFDRHEARQHFEDRNLSAERTEDRSELNSDCTRGLPTAGVVLDGIHC